MVHTDLASHLVGILFKRLQSTIEIATDCRPAVLDDHDQDWQRDGRNDQHGFECQRTPLIPVQATQHAADSFGELHENVLSVSVGPRYTKGQATREQMIS